MSAKSVVSKITKTITDDIGVIEGVKFGTLPNLDNALAIANVHVPSVESVYNQALSDVTDVVENKVPEIGTIDSTAQVEITNIFDTCPTTKKLGCLRNLSSFLDSMSGDLSDKIETIGSIMACIGDGNIESLFDLFDDSKSAENDEVNLANEIMKYDFNLTFLSDVFSTIQRVETLAQCLGDLGLPVPDISEVTTFCDDMYINPTTKKLDVPKLLDDGFAGGPMSEAEKIQQKLRIKTTDKVIKIGANRAANRVSQLMKSPDLSFMGFLSPSVAGLPGIPAGLPTDGNLPDIPMSTVLPKEL